MKIIDKEVVEKILTLSRLYLKEDEKDEIIPQLEEILNYFKVIDEIDTKNIEPMFHPPLQKLNFREDKNVKTFDREDLQEISPDFENGFVKVPKIIGE
ncbi:MAG: Asp-tRNA(Asn)/Glu-tRNA(Gln) amidotransferase subunit GatC [Caldisericia bacterium]|nr:Asp-tRNA(Asn)/Glu-tRNA(Gln) amidotransferase subunit GatC [Caldisericia bacterium]